MLAVLPEQLWHTDSIPLGRKLSWKFCSSRAWNGHQFLAQTQPKSHSFSIFSLPKRACSCFRHHVVDRREAKWCYSQGTCSSVKKILIILKLCRIHLENALSDTRLSWTNSWHWGLYQTNTHKCIQKHIYCCVSSFVLEQNWECGWGEGTNWTILCKHTERHDSHRTSRVPINFLGTTNNLRE